MVAQRGCWCAMIEGRTATQDYQYDVFFSYKRHPLTLEWTRGVVRLLRLWLELEVGRRDQPACSLTRTVLKLVIGGQRGCGRLSSLSRCMICVWSPSVFSIRSGVCPSGRAFAQREKRVRMGSHGLIAHRSGFHDGEHFPAERSQDRVDRLRAICVYRTRLLEQLKRRKNWRSD
jgi:hypothetical protein